MNKYELESRLIELSVAIIDLSSNFKDGPASNVIAYQLIRSDASPALNYAEAQDAESTKDFVHKLKIVLKELRETIVALKIVKDARLCHSQRKLEDIVVECNELVSILVSSIKTLKKKLQSSQSTIQNQS